MGKGGFISLLAVENAKLWKRPSSKIMLIVLAVLIILLIGSCKWLFSVLKVIAPPKDTLTIRYDSGWKYILQVECDELKSDIDEAEKSTVYSDKNAIDSYKMQIAEKKYMIEHNLMPKNKEKYSPDFWEMMSSNVATPVALLAIIACSALVAGEFSQKTMKMMIPRPFARWQILTAKLIAIALYSLALTVVTYIFMFLSVALIFGTKGIGDYQLVWLGGHVFRLSGGAQSLLNYGLQYIQVLVFVIMALALSSIFRSRALSTGVSVFLLIGGKLAALPASNLSFGKYIFFSVTNFSMQLTEGAPYYGATLDFALILSAAYCAVFLAAGYLTFAKRDID